MADWYEDSLAQKDEANKNTRLQVANDMQIDPDRASRIWHVQANTKLPASVVDADLENLEEQLKASSFDKGNYTDANNGAPVFNRFAAENPYNLAVLERDRKNLTRLERSLAPVFQMWDKGWATVEMADIVDRQMNRGEGAEQTEGEIRRLNEIRQLMQGDDTSTGFTKFLSGFANQIPMYTYIIRESLDEAAAGMATGAAVGGLYGAAGGTFVAPGLGTVTGGAAGAAGGSIIGGSVGFAAGRTLSSAKLERALAFDDYRELGLNEKDARLYANVIGGVNGALESIGLSVITKHIPGFRAIQRDMTGQLINQVLVKPTMRNAFTRLALTYGEVQAVEMLTESAQEATLTVGREMLKRDAREAGDTRPELAPMTGDEFRSMLMDTIEHTFYGTAILGGMGPVTQFYGDSKKAHSARQRLSALEAMGEAAKDSKTRTETPSKYDDFISRLSDNGRNDTIIVTAEKFDEYFQTQGMDPDEVAVTLGISKEDLAEGRDVTGEIAIPMKEYLTTIAATEHHDALMHDLKTSSEGFTYTEAQAFKANEAEAMKTIEGMAEVLAGDQAQDEQIMADIIGQLRALNFSSDAASKSAEVLRGIPNLARREGMEPLDLFNQVFAGVKGPRDPALQHQNIDAAVDPYIDMIRTGNIPTQRDIFGPSLLDFITDRGGLAPDAELDARDFRQSAIAGGKLGAIRNDGDTLDGMAEVAHEQGFIAARDPNLLLEAIDRELAGDTVHSQFNTNAEQQGLAGQLDRLSQAIDEAGLNLDELDNAQVRKILQTGETFDQIDTDELNNLTDFLFNQAEIEHSQQQTDFSHHNRVDTMLARAEALLAQKTQSLAAEQDFSDTTLEVPFIEAETGKTGKIDVNAQEALETAQKRSGMMQKLLDCLNG